MSVQYVQLKFTHASITAVYSSGQRQEVPQRCVERSKLLSNLSSSEHSGAETPAPCPGEELSLWVDLVVGRRSLTAEELVSALTVRCWKTCITMEASTDCM